MRYQQNIPSLLIVLFFLGTACRPEEVVVTPNDISEFEAKVRFEKTGQKAFSVDSLADWYFVIPQAIESNGQSKVLSLDMVSNAVLQYDYESGRLEKRIAFPKAGPGSTKGNIIGFQALSEEMLLIIDEGRQLHLSDFDGSVKKKFNAKIKATDAPIVKANAIPAILNGDELLLESYPIINPNEHMKVVLNVNDETIDHRSIIPREYIDGFWGIGDFQYYSFAHNAKANKVIYNFPNLDSVYIYDLNYGQPEKRYAGSRKFSEPISDAVEYGKRPSPIEMKQLPLRRHIFSRLFYDSFKDVYYRLVGMPISQDVLNLNDPKKSEIRLYSVLVLDANFEWLGEFDLPPYEYLINIDMVFLNEKGLHFQRESVNEDEAIFDVWSIVD